jgi:diaminopimelate epimerase
VRRVAFEKYEGLGNDFLIVDEAALPLSGGLSASVADDVKRLCDRHFGVGGDGVLVVGAPRSPGSAGSMVVLNADGSRPEMCGNGLRCVAGYLASRKGMSAGSFTVDTDSGPLGCEVDGRGPGSVAEGGRPGGSGGESSAGWSVTIEMGEARMLGALSLEAAGVAVKLERVSTGNPHAISFGPHAPGDFERIGPVLAVHGAFPEGTNVELVEDEADGGLRVRVWERGVGPTLACGTGACAVAAAACSLGLRRFDHELPVRLPGGQLWLRVDRGMRVRMRGPARLVFRGEVLL